MLALGYWVLGNFADIG